MNQQSSSKKAELKASPNAGATTDSNLIQKNANLESKKAEPDYTSMETEIEKVSDPVSFEALQEFYGLK